MSFWAVVGAIIVGLIIWNTWPIILALVLAVIAFILRLPKFLLWDAPVAILSALGEWLDEVIQPYRQPSHWKDKETWLWDHQDHWWHRFKKMPNGTKPTYAPMYPEKKP